MKNKQHKYILKAYLESKVPSAVKCHSHLVALDSYLSGYSSQLLKSENFKVPAEVSIDREDKLFYSELINSLKGEEKEDLIVYYRLVTLVELILSRYKDE